MVNSLITGGGDLDLYVKIKLLAKKKEVSIAQIERDCGLSSASISKWNKSIPNAKKLNLVANYLGVTIQYLLENTKQEV